MTCGFVVDERYFWHDARDAGGNNVEAGVEMESPIPRRRMLNLINKVGLDTQLTPLSVEEVAYTDMARVHPETYLKSFKKQSDESGGSMGDFANFGPGSYEIAALAAGGIYAATEAVITGEVDTAYALVRPPGHHAETGRGRGYCLLANIPIAIEKARANLGISRVAVIDWDVHHGNGTQQVFWEDPDVLSISIHQNQLFPMESGFITEVGGTNARGSNINVPLSAGAGYGAYEHAFEAIVEPALRQFQPDLIVVACGFDASALDPMGRMMLTPQGFYDLTIRTKKLAAELCSGKLVFAHEGGYSPIAVPFCGVYVLSALLGSEPAAKFEDYEYLDTVEDQKLNRHHRDQIDAAVAAVNEAGRFTL